MTVNICVMCEQCDNIIYEEPFTAEKLATLEKDGINQYVLSPTKLSRAYGKHKKMGQCFRRTAFG